MESKRPIGDTHKRKEDFMNFNKGFKNFNPQTKVVKHKNIRQVLEKTKGDQNWSKKTIKNGAGKATKSSSVS